MQPHPQPRLGRIETRSDSIDFSFFKHWSRLRLTVPRRFLVQALLPMLLAVGMNSANAVEWEALGPFGGGASTVMVNPLRDVLYANVGRGPLYRSENKVTTWIATASFPDCAGENAWPPVARADGDIFVICGLTLFRGRDDGRTWSVFLKFPMLYAGAAELPVFDPTRTGRAVQRAIDVIYATEDDGVTWRELPQNILAPRLYAFDPRRSGRLVALHTEGYLGGGTSSVLWESFDLGATWRTASTILPAEARPLPCYGEELVFGPDGTLFVNTLCGSYRSLDGGATWAAMSEPQVHNPRDPLAEPTGLDPTGLTPDRFRNGHVLAWSHGRVIESFDDGFSWLALPPPPAGLPYQATGRNAIAITKEGQVLIATIGGIHQLNRADESWDARVFGLQGVRMLASEIIPTQPSRLLAPQYDKSSVSSSDGGLTWSAWTIASQSIRYVHRNPTAPFFLFATTADGALHRSADGGHTWTRVLPPPDLARYETVIEYVVPIGPQPGLVYGLSGFCRDSGFTGCFWTPRDVVRSLDGGETWKSLFKTGVGTGSVPPQIAVGPVASQLAVSPADPNRLLMLTMTDLYRSRDRGDTWEPAAPMPSGHARLVADPADAARWYAFLPSGPVLRSDDFAASWSVLSSPSAPTGVADLLIDPLSPARLYLVARDGAVSMSEDRGGHWQALVAPSSAIISGARLAPLAGNVIYAGSTLGVLKLVLRAPTAPRPISLIEYHRPDLNHYFMTSDSPEIAKLDAAGGPFARTGHAFNIWPVGARDDDAASVCRFYGRPEAHLDTHFFTASPTECEQVIARFSESWILESPRVFSVALPSSAGKCREGTVPVYRLFNNRPDVNHRYTTSASVRNEMRNAGWIVEGYGPDAVAMCSPQYEALRQPMTKRIHSLE